MALPAPLRTASATRKYSVAQQILEVCCFCSLIAVVVAADPAVLPDTSYCELAPPGTEMACAYKSGSQANYFRPCDDDPSLQCNYRICMNIWWEDLPDEYDWIEKCIVPPTFNWRGAKSLPEGAQCVILNGAGVLHEHVPVQDSGFDPDDTLDMRALHA